MKKLRGIPTILGALVVLNLLTYFRTTVYKGGHPITWDFHFMNVDTFVYFAAGSRVNAGMKIYDTPILSGNGLPFDLLFTYPPFAAAVFSIPAPIIFPMVKFLIWKVGSFLAMYAVIMMVLRQRLGHLTPLAWVGGFLATAGSLALEPVQGLVYFGQINTFLMLLVCMDFLPKKRWPGIGVGLAAGLKLTPALFGLIFLIQRRWIAAITSFVTFLGTVVIGYWYVPDANDFWTRAMFDSNRVGPKVTPTSQDINSILIRVFNVNGGPLLILLDAIVLIFLVVAVYVAIRRKDPATAVVMTGIAACLISPISWYHHWVWVVPLLIMVLIDVNRRVISNKLAAPIALLVVVLYSIPWIAEPLAPHIFYEKLASYGKLGALLFTFTGFATIAVYAIYGMVYDPLVRGEKARKFPLDGRGIVDMAPTKAPEAATEAAVD